MQYQSNQPIISFIIPIFNTQDYLVECIESILKQNVDKEIILIDDCSTDNSWNIALNYAKKYDFIYLIKNTVNQGQSASRNKGIHLAKGEYIFFVDSDDYLLKDNLREICKFGDLHQADIIKLQALQANEKMIKEGRAYNIPSAFENIERNQTVIFTGYECLSHMVKNWMPAICWSIIRRDFILRNNILFMEGVKAEDQLFYLQLLTCHSDIKIIEIGNPIYFYRHRNNSTSSFISFEYIQDHFKVCSLIYQWLQLKELKGNVKASIHKVVSNIYKSGLRYLLEYLEHTNNPDGYERLFQELLELSSKVVNHKGVDNE